MTSSMAGTTDISRASLSAVPDTVAAMTIAKTVHVDVVDLAAGLDAAIDRVAATFDRIVITRDGQPVAALVAADDLEQLEELEDAADAADFDAAIAEDDGERILADGGRKRLGLDGAGE